MENQVEKTIKHERDYRVSWFWISCIIMVLRTSNRQQHDVGNNSGLQDSANMLVAFTDAEDSGKQRSWSYASISALLVR